MQKIRPGKMMILWCDACVFICVPLLNEFSNITIYCSLDVVMYCFGPFLQPLAGWVQYVLLLTNRWIVQVRKVKNPYQDFLSSD